MPIIKKTINLEVQEDTLTATDAVTGAPTTDAGFQGEDGAVLLRLQVPDDWRDLTVRLQVAAANGSCDLSGLPQAGVIEMPLSSLVTVPGGLTVSLLGMSPDGVRRTAQCGSLSVSAVDCPVDAVPQLYPLAFENLYNDVANNVVRTITGSGGAKVTKTGSTAYNIDVSGTGGDMLQTNYAAGAGAKNSNLVDHAVYADATGAVDSAAHADKANLAAAAQSADAGSALETAISAKQPLLTAGGNGGVDILNGNTVRSLCGIGINLVSDDNTVSLGIDGALMTAGMVAYFAQSDLPDGWLPADGSALNKIVCSNLYSVIGDRYGKGAINGVEVTPSCFYDDGESHDIVLQKYASGIQTAAYFKSGGTIFTGGSFKLKTAGSYTVYCVDENGLETVQYAALPVYSAPFLLDVAQGVLTSDLKRTVRVHKVGGSLAISVVKLSAGIQPVAYFAGAGTTLGTTDGASVTFQAGTAYPAGIYTWYAKDAAGNEAVQYVNVVLQSTLSVNLGLDYGSDEFRVPDLTGTIKNLTAGIKD